MGCYQDQRVADVLRRNIEEIRAEDALLLVLGSNDARDVARDLKPNAREGIKTAVWELAETAIEKRFLLVVTAPAPSPCYGKPWCIQTESDEGCDHEVRYRTAAQSIIETINEALEPAGNSAQLLPIHRRFQFRSTDKVSRRYFRFNNIHHNTQGAEKLCLTLFTKVK